MNNRFRMSSNEAFATPQGYLTWIRGLMEGESVTIDHLRAQLAAKQSTVDTLLQGFVVSEFPVVAGLAFDVLYQPAAALERLGGDWYDIFNLPDGRVAFTLGDVCGRGLGAAVKMGQAKQAIKVAASLQINNPMPLAVLEQTNKVIFLNDHQVEFTTAIYGVINLENRTVTYASAGHHPPILAKAGEKPQILPNHGFPLGVEINLPDLIKEHEFIYESGDLLVLYTDGLIEYSHDADEGEVRLLRAAHDAVTTKAESPAKFIVDSVLREESKYPDDVAVLTIFFK
jgi:serine phosphatase RsbU (regulator of sigma subunit)